MGRPALLRQRPAAPRELPRADRPLPRADVGKATSFATIEEAVAHGPALVGTPERVAEKIVDYHKSFRHDVQSVSVFPVLPYAQQQEVLARFAEEVVPLVRREVSTTLWGPQDTGRAKGFTAPAE